MLIHSLRPENLQRQEVRVVLGKIRLGEEHTNLTHLDMVEKAETLRKKAKVTKEGIGFNIFNEGVDEFGHTELVMEVWHKRLETDAEQKDRIQRLQVRDLQEFYKLLSSFKYVCRERENLKKMFDKLGHTKSTPPDWMKDMLKEFFAHDLTEVLSEIQGIYGDAVKYPQLALPEHQLERLRKLL